MPADPPAPWAEPVLLTAEDLKAREDDFWRYELLEGRLVRMPPTSFEHGEVELNLASELRSFVRMHSRGRVVSGDPGFHVSRPGEPDTVLAPDIAFVAANRAPEPGTPQSTGFPRLPPDLVAEIASPSQGRPEMAAKARLWLQVGVQLVWVVWPGTHQVDVWRPGPDEPVVTLEATDELEGEDVLPGFTYPVARLFA